MTGVRLTIDDWGDPVLSEAEVDRVMPADLDDFYVNAKEWERPNLFFLLLNSCHRYLDRGRGSGPPACAF